MSTNKTSKYKGKTRIPLDATLFDSALLQDEIAVESAIGVLEVNLENAIADYDSLLQDLLAHNGLFEFVFAELSSRGASVVKEHIIGVFPSNARDFEDSLAFSLLSRLSRYFWHHGYPDENLEKQHQLVQIAAPVIRALAKLDLPSDSQNGGVNAPGGESEGLPVMRKSNQRERKKSKRTATQALSIDNKLFAKLNVEPPSSAHEASELERQLLGDQKDILMHYFDVLRKPDLAALYKATYIAFITRPDDPAPSCAQNNSNYEADKTANQADDNPSQPPVLSNILPTQAALYFDSVEGFGDWHIQISTRADRDLRAAQRSDQKRFAIYLKKIRELSNGHFSDDNHKPLTGSDHEIPIYEAKMTRDSRLVYQIDCVKEYEEETERQIIKVFGIYTHAQLDRSDFWTTVSKHLSGKGKEYKRRCLYRTQPTNARDKVYAPATFPLSSEKPIVGSTTSLPYLHEADKQDLHSLLVLEKFVTFSQALLNTILADEDAAHVFHMSPTEQAIVRHTGSCYVRGRSGTGKTTTMLFKMLGIEQAHEMLAQNARTQFASDVPHPRQIFVTQSQVLADKVREYYMKLSASRIAARRTAKESAKLASEQKHHVEQGLFDNDEEEFHHGTLPKSFAELNGSHFPLFITYDHLCRMLEGPESHTASSEGSGSDATENRTVATEYMLQRRASFVSYNKFLSGYWPHLPQGLTKSFDPALVFAEFMSIIKGSKESETGYIDLEAYISITRRQQGTFTRDRDVVYMLFLEYLKMKQDRGEWDVADRTNSILRSIRSHGVPGSKVDYIYVDEVQDNLIIDALLLRTLCRNPNGLFWAGDTAQTISAGSSFRFEALKSLMYSVEQSGHDSVMNKPPRDFQLIANYRSHGGIVDAAHSIVKLLMRFWPQTIDTLSDERAEVDGAKPIFFTGWDQDTVQYEQFLFGASGSHIEFGANQCILVRDDNARDELRKQVGDIGTVLTLYESKGLEFNDVLLYNFFEDSTVDVGQWRVILNALPQSDQGGLRCPAFDENRHSGVCRELKFLYVAITRARQNIWIADCSDKGEPLRMFWTVQGLVNSVSAVGNVPHLAISSRPDEWAAMARTLFDNKRFSQASRAFDRAGMPRARDIADAYYRREMARRLPVSSSSIVDHRSKAFLEAAQAFSGCADATTLPKERLAYSRNAAECYLEASEMKMAAEAYLRAEEHTKAAQAFRQGGLFDEAVDTIEQYAGQIEPADAKKIQDVARIHYSIEQNLDRASRLFSNVDDALDFMEGFGFDVARVKILEQCGRIQEAAEIHLTEGRVLEAIRLVLSQPQESFSRLESYFLRGIWENLSFGGQLGVACQSQLQELLLLSKEALAHGSFTTKLLDELALVQAILDDNALQLRVLADSFIRTHNDPGTGALCLDRALRTWPQLKKASAKEVMQTVQAFDVYIRELLEMLSDRYPAENSVLQRLFGFYPTPETEHLVTIPSSTLLHAYIVNPKTRWVQTVSSNKEGSVLIPWELSKALRDMLREQILQKIRDESSACLEAPAFRICPAFVMFGERDPRHHCNSSHDPQEISPGSTCMRLRLLLQQIITYQAASVFERRNERAKQRRRWMSCLYDAYFPVYGKAGSAIDVDLSTVPEADKGIQVIKEWIRELLFNERYEMMPSWQFLTFVAQLGTLTWRFEKNSAVQIFRWAPCITADKPADLIRQGDRYIVWDLLDFLQLSERTCLSAGVLFIRNVFDRQLPIDANVICHIFELLCAAYLIGHRLRVRGSLHEITLSRRLLSRLYANEALKEYDHRMLRHFISLLCTILREMYVGSSGFLLYNRSSHIDYQVRNIFVMRICKSITLLGYNINDPGLHELILHQFASFKALETRPDARYSAIFNRYVTARSWEDLVRAVRNTGSYEKNSPEELIHLRDASKLLGTPREVFGTRSIVYKTIIDIPGLLRGDLLPPSAPTRDGPFSALASSTDHGTDLDGRRQANERDSVEDKVEMQVPAEAEDAGITEPGTMMVELEANREQHTVVAPTVHQIQAAQLLTTVYRRKLAHRQFTAETGLKAESARLYQTFQESSHLETMPRRYRMLFLGPLPLAILCLRNLTAFIAKAKVQARARMTLGPHSDYERNGAQIIALNTVDRRIQRLKKLMEPNSEFHLLASEEELRVHVQEVVDIADEHPRAIEGLEWELNTAVKGIVRKPMPKKLERTAPAPKKQELVVDSEGEELYYEYSEED